MAVISTCLSASIDDFAYRRRPSMPKPWQLPPMTTRCCCPGKSPSQLPG